MTRAQIRDKLGITVLEPASIADAEMTEQEAKEYENDMAKVIECFRRTADEKKRNPAPIITPETFSEENRDRRIGNSTYRICRQQHGKKRWYIREGFNDLEKGHWAQGHGFFTDSLQEAIDTINGFTREREVIDRKRGEQE